MKILNNAPWWLVSAGIHAVILMAAALVVIEQAFATDAPPIIVQFTERPMVNPEPPIIDRGIEDSKSLPSNEPEKSTNDDPLIFFPIAKESDHNESKSNKDGHTMEGESLLFRGYIPGGQEGFGANKTGQAGSHRMIGVGSGAGTGGRFGRPDDGGREDLAKKYGGGRLTESAVTAALRWLGRHQSADGGWSTSGYSHQCSGAKCTGAGEADYDTGVTSLSLLAFLGAGYTQLSREELKDPAGIEPPVRPSDVVKRSLQWLLSRQDPEGCVGERGMKYMYNHAVAALALSEAYGMTSATPLKEPAQKAIDFLIASQNPGKGWRYSNRCGDNDTSVTGWAVMALKSAEISGLNFPASAYQGAMNWFNEATEQNGYYRAGYNAAGTGKVFVPGKNEQFADHPSMSAVAVMSRIFIQKKRDPALAAANFLTADLPAWKPGQVDFYYWYYASLALFQYDGPKGPAWSKWNEPMKNAIVPNQKTATAGCENGSWDPAADRWGFEGGRVYAAAINCLTLEVYYRYKNVFGGTSK